MLIANVKKELYLMAKSYNYQDEDIADIIQETIYLAYKNISKLRDVSLFRTWIVRILINECKKFYKKNKNIYSLDDENNYKEPAYENNHERMGFDELISILDKEEKMIFTLFFYMGFTTKEISKVLKIKDATIRSKIARGKQKIKSKLEKGGV
jgi:RNA polymerase sigma-70 factor (ECF subfamily)